MEAGSRKVGGDMIARSVPESPRPPVVRRAVLAITPEQRKRILDVLSCIEVLHHRIDPLMFDIDLDAVAALQRIFGDGVEDPPATVSVTYGDLATLELCVMAADTYSHRHDGRGICHLADEVFDDAGQWVTRALRWFYEPLDPSSGD
jgi:hypothetical protein